jgi:hypothetical protein
VAHRNIKKFSIEGEFLNDSLIPITRAQYETLVVGDMRRKGYVPVLDLDTQWSTEYHEGKDRWFFALSIYGVYLGKKKAKLWEGLSAGSLVPRSIQKATSRES